MELTIVPSVDPSARRALDVVLRDASLVMTGSPRYDDPWRRTAFMEAVERDDPEVGYALSPRKTRGATRA